MKVRRRTVYHWIDTGQLERELDNEPARYMPRAPVARNIDPYREIILAVIAGTCSRLRKLPRQYIDIAIQARMELAVLLAVPPKGHSRSCAVRSRRPGLLAR